MYVCVCVLYTKKAETELKMKCLCKCLGLPIGAKCPFSLTSAVLLLSPLHICKKKIANPLTVKKKLSVGLSPNDHVGNIRII